MREKLKGVRAFASLTDGERGALAEHAAELSCEPPEDVFAQGEEGRALYAVVSGAIELRSTISGGLTKTFTTARQGAIFGLLSFVDGDERPATARVVESSTLLVLEREALERFAAEHPAAADKLRRALAGALAAQVRVVVEEYRRIVRWALDISGATGLGLTRLIADEVELGIELMSGSSFRGVLLSADQSGAAPEYYFRTADGEVRYVPHHAIAQATFKPAALKVSADLVEGL